MTVGSHHPGSPTLVQNTAAHGDEYPLRVEYDLTPAGWKIFPSVNAGGERDEENQPAVNFNAALFADRNGATAPLR